MRVAFLGNLRREAPCQDVLLSVQLFRFPVGLGEDNDLLLSSVFTASRQSPGPLRQLAVICYIQRAYFPHGTCGLLEIMRHKDLNLNMT